MTYTWITETLLGPIECQGDMVDFLTRDVSKAEHKELLLIGLFYRHKFWDNSKKSSRRGRPIKLISIDSERAAIILNLAKWQKTFDADKEMGGLCSAMRGNFKNCRRQTGNDASPRWKELFS